MLAAPGLDLLDDPMLGHVRSDSGADSTAGLAIPHHRVAASELPTCRRMRERCPSQRRRGRWDGSGTASRAADGPRRSGTHSRGALVVLSKSDDGRRDTCRARLPHCGLSAFRCDADPVPVRIGCEEGQPEPRIMRLAQDRDPLGLPLLKGRVELVGSSTVNGQTNLTGARDVR